MEKSSLNNFQSTFFVIVFYSRMSFTYSNKAKAERFDRCSDIVEEPQLMLLPIEGHEKVPLVSLEESVLPLVQIRVANCTPFQHFVPQKFLYPI